MAQAGSKTDPLSSGMTMSGGSADPISAQFSKIRSLIGPATPASGGGPGNATPAGSGLVGTPNFTAGGNSSDILRQGINLVGGAGQSLLGQGSSTFGSGLNILNDPTAFYQAILSGDPTRISQALAPTAAAVSQQYAPAITQAQQMMPRGGYSASTAAELPFTEAGAVGNAALGLQNTAAQGLSQLGSTVAGLGQGEQSLGLQGIEQIIQAALGKMGVTTPLTQQLQQVGSFISSII